MTKKEKCKHCFANLKSATEVEYLCVFDRTTEDHPVVSDEICENCPNFKSKFIEYPLTINGINNEEINTNGLFHKTGSLCEIRPCAEEYKGKSYIGFYIGDLPIAINSSFNTETKILTNRVLPNPAIFVPELKKIIYGCESWWRVIKSVDDFTGISEEDINNTWYVQALKMLSKENNDNKGEK